MPVETLRPPDGRLAALPFASAMPFRILNKGPDYFRRRAEPAARRLSAVERLEADKAKYVKSQQVALTRQAPIKAPIIRKPLLPPGTLPGHAGAPPARKVPRCPAEDGGEAGGRRPALDLHLLTHLIGDVREGAAPCYSSSASPSSPSSGATSVGSSASEERDGSRVPPSPGSAPSPLADAHRCPAVEPARRPPPVPARAPRFGAPNTVTVRRVDVRPQAELRRTPLQPRPLRPRQTPQGQVPPAPPPQAPPSPPAYLPPASPAFTRVSGASSRGSSRRRPPLHRYKSDLSDRLSRATADLQRFFNYCGLDADEVDAMGGVERFTRASSDIVSLSKLRSASTPSSEGGDDAERPLEDGEDEDGPGRTGGRVPYGISVIERNARVIKWLYGIRQARDGPQGGAVSNV